MEVTEIDKSHPPSPDSQGFGVDVVLPSPLVVETTAAGDEEMVSRRRGKGRPRRGEELVGETSVNVSNIVMEPRRPSSSSSTCPPRTPTSTAPPASRSTPSVSSSKSQASSETRSRQSEYLVGYPISNFGYAKLPKGRAVLGKFLHNLKDSDPFKAASETAGELLDVWCHHFGSRLVFGYASQTHLQKRASYKRRGPSGPRSLISGKSGKD